MKVVLDTNVFVSGIHWKGASEKILRAWFNSEFELVTSPEIVEEVIRILMRFKIPLDPQDISWWESIIFERSNVVIPTEKVDVVADPDDNKFIEAAIKSKAQYIVSQDKHLLIIEEYRGTKILHPNEFLKIISNTENV